MVYLQEIKCSVAVSKLLKIAILIRTKQTHLHVKIQNDSNKSKKNRFHFFFFFFFFYSEALFWFCYHSKEGRALRTHKSTNFAEK